MYCGEHTLVKRDGREIHAVSLRCRAWTCPDCAPMRKRQLTAQAIAGKPNTFLTLTCRRRDDMTPEEAARRLAWAWRTLRKRIARRWHGVRIAFLAVVERHQSGWPHLHILMRAPYIPQAWLSDQMRELADGPIVHIRRIDAHGRAVVYCAKYAGKATQRIGNTKRYWRSPDYDLRPPEQRPGRTSAGGGWERDTWSIARIIRSWCELGWRVTIHDPWRASALIVQPWDTG